MPAPSSPLARLLRREASAAAAAGLARHEAKALRARGEPTSAMRSRASSPGRCEIGRRRASPCARPPQTCACLAVVALVSLKRVAVALVLSRAFAAGARDAPLVLARFAATRYGLQPRLLRRLAKQAVEQASASGRREPPTQAWRGVAGHGHACELPHRAALADAGGPAPQKVRCSCHSGGRGSGSVASRYGCTA